jgi:uncharacterized membrane protein (DUF485 family)
VAASAEEHDWAAIARSPQFRELVANRRRFLIAGTCFYCAYFFGFLGLLAFAPDTMAKTVFGSVSVALVAGMSLVLLAFVMAFLHARRANQWDRMAEGVVEAVRPEARFSKDGVREESLR